jgi:hypothetical protein
MASEGPLLNSGLMMKPSLQYGTNAKPEEHASGFDVTA